MIKLMIWRWRDYPGLSGWAQHNQKDFIRQKQKGQVRERGVITETEAEVMLTREAKEGR